MEILKFKFKGWNFFEIVWLSAFTIIGVILAVLFKYNAFGFTVFLSGILCVVLAAKGNIWTYIYGTYNTFGYAYLAYTNGLFGEMGLNLAFFAPMNIVGFFMWKKRMDEKIVIMRQLTNRNRVIITIGSIIATIITGYCLSMIPKQNNPYIDAATVVLSIVATILMVFRYKEQWIVYIIINIISIILWTIRMVHGSPDGAVMIAMWSAYLVNAIYGYIIWSIGSKKNIEGK